MSEMERIRDFLEQKRFAIVGVSREPHETSRALYREFLARGYEPIAVNSVTKDIEGRPCYARLQDIEPPVDTVLLMTNAAATESLVRDCVEMGVKRVWMYRGASKPGAVSRSAVAFCEQHGMAVVPGQCPFMFLPGVSWFHRCHGFIKKIAGSYPQ